MTQLEAVNVCLEAIGEQPVNVVPTSGVSEASLANNVVNRISREVQSLGLNCNTEESYPFVTDTEGFLYVPQNVLHIDPSDGTLDCVVRGNRLYNKTLHSFSFNTTSFIECDVVWYFPFEDLPDHVRTYIAIVAARTFQRSFLGSTNLNAMSKEDEQRALVNFRRMEDNTDDRTMLDCTPVKNILQRIR